MREKLMNYMSIVILVYEIVLLMFLLIKGFSTEGLLLLGIKLYSFLLAAFTDTSRIFLAFVSIFVGIMTAILLSGFMIAVGIIFAIIGVFSILVILN